MQESGRTRTDASGRFTLAVPDEGVQHLIRVVHQGVNYHKPAPQGATSVDVEVYDVAKQVDKIFGEGRVVRLQTSNGQLQVSEMYILRNESTPPRTRMSDRSFELTVPDGAEVESGMAAGPGGMPVTSAPVPTGEKNHYAFIFPIRPGTTQFQITYHLAYKGSYTFDLSSEMPFAELGVMLPKSMRFTATGDGFQPATDESGMSTYVVKSVSPGQHVAFAVSGEGSAPREAQGGSTVAPDARASSSEVPVPPENSISTVGYVLGALLIVLVGGAYFVARRPVATETGPAELAATSTIAVSVDRVGALPVPASLSVQSGAAPKDSVLNVVKDELFQIETERLQGKISEQEYQKLKTGINALIRRHMRGRS
jgi:hypothetical protein